MLVIIFPLPLVGENNLFSYYLLPPAFLKSFDFVFKKNEAWLNRFDDDLEDS